MEKYIDEDFIGKRFGRLIVINIFRRRESNRVAKYCHCKCQCGNEKDVRIDALHRGDTLSCGCLSRENSSIRLKKRATKHGFSHHVLYQTWEHIINRCYNKNCKTYRHYGGRGITVCDEWRKHPEKFIEFALNNGWNKSLSIDRIDVNGNYEPSNCRFTNRHVQSANQRKSIKNKSGYVGITWDKSRDKWVSWISLNYKTHNLGRFDNKKDALDTRNNYIIEHELFEYPIQEWKGE